MYKTLGFMWLFEESYPASAFVTADRDQARKPKRFIPPAVRTVYNPEKSPIPSF
jgi:hypothetical protein